MEDIELDLENAIERIGDKELFLEIARYFADSLPELAEQLATAVHAGRTSEAGRFAHSLKSNCAMVGADSLRQQAYALELAGREADQAAVTTVWAELQPQLELLRCRLLALS